MSLSPDYLKMKGKDLASPQLPKMPKWKDLNTPKKFDSSKFCTSPQDDSKKQRLLSIHDK